MKKSPKKEFICEQDRIMAAFAKVNLREAVDPIFRGKIVEDEDTYNKVQQLLDCPDMEHAHQFLLDVDFEDLTPEVKQKVDDLYQLAISQGYLDTADPAADEEADEDFADSEEELEDEVDGDGAQPQVSDASGGFETAPAPDPTDAASKDSIGMNAPVLNTAAFVLFYSAMKNGEIRTGECYSNATTMENAKLDAVQKLQKLGFTAIEIIAAEECDPSAKGAEDQPAKFGAQVNDPDPTSVEDVDFETVGEAEEKADNEKKEKEEEDKEEEPEEDSAEEEEEEKELSRSEKLDLFKRYLEEFKGLLQKMKAETYADMALADRAKFYDEMAKIWSGKPDPAKFMSDDNVKQIEHMKIKIAK